MPCLLLRINRTFLIRRPYIHRRYAISLCQTNRDPPAQLVYTLGTPFRLRQYYHPRRSRAPAGLGEALASSVRGHPSERLGRVSNARSNDSNVASGSDGYAFLTRSRRPRSNLVNLAEPVLQRPSTADGGETMGPNEAHRRVNGLSSLRSWWQGRRVVACTRLLLPQLGMM